MKKSIKKNKIYFLTVAVFISFSIFLVGCLNNESSGDKIENLSEMNQESKIDTESSTDKKQDNSTVSESEEEIEKMENITIKDNYKECFLVGNIYTPASLESKNKELLLEQFNAITPENLMKPENMQPVEGNFEYMRSDEMVVFAKENNLSITGHTLVWHQQTPAWMASDVTRDEAIEQLKSHITTIVSKYKGEIMSWDVVNEVIADGVTLPQDGDWTKCLRETKWLEAIGPEYISMAYTFAKEADPNAKLYYNDYNLNVKEKADIAYAMIKDLREQGVPIDGIGMQAHYDINTTVESVKNSLEKFSKLGIEISITELDISVHNVSFPGLTEKQEKNQAILYAKLFVLFKEYKDSIERVTFWGALDNFSWRKEKYPCLYNATYKPKEAYYAVANPEKYLEENNH